MTFVIIPNTFVVDVLQASEYFEQDKEKLLALNRWQQMHSPTVIFPNNKQKNSEHPVCGIDHIRPSTDSTIQKGNKDILGVDL